MIYPLTLLVYGGFFLGGFMDLVIQFCLLILFTVVCNHGYCSFLFYFF